MKKAPKEDENTFFLFFTTFFTTFFYIQLSGGKAGKIYYLNHCYQWFFSKNKCFHFIGPFSYRVRRCPGPPLPPSRCPRRVAHPSCLRVDGHLRQRDLVHVGTPDLTDSTCRHRQPKQHDNQYHAASSLQLLSCSSNYRPGVYFLCRCAIYSWGRCLLWEF